MTEASVTRRSRRKHTTRQRRVVGLAPLGQLVPGLTQILMGRKIVGALGLLTSAAGLAAVITLVMGFLVDRRVGLGWATQERPLTVILVVALVLGVAWLAVGAHLAVTIWRRQPHDHRRPWVTPLVMLVAILQLVVAGGVAYYANVQREFVSSLFPDAAPVTVIPAPSNGVTPTPTPPPEPPGRINILLLGGDAGPGRWRLRPDSISVISVDLDTAKTTIIGIPRNLQKSPFSEGSPLWGPWPDGYNCGGQCLISYLFTFASLRPEMYPNTDHPGIEATRDAVEGVLGIDIPYAVLIDMQGFTDLVNAVGGIDLCVPYAIWDDRHTKITVPAGCQHMDGETALAYSRARHDSNDYNRMSKQRSVQEALLAQADPLTVLQNFQKLTTAGSEYITTDIPQDQLGVLLDAAIRGRGIPPTTLELVPPKFSSVHPNFDEYHAAVKKLLGEDE